MTAPFDTEPASYRALLAVRLPRPEPFRAPGCMAAAGITWPRRLARQAWPRRGAASCCWYHAVNWHNASRAALGIARRVGLHRWQDCDDLYSQALDVLEASHPGGLQGEAVESLLMPADAIQLYDRGRSYTNGQHRAQAMLEQGVHRTLIVAWPEG
ncbi:MAG: hypothetical protein ACRDPY_11975 [Streptosporangiaceae bacterium]